MSASDAQAALRRVVAVADTDSYVKWSAALLDLLPAGVGELVVLQTPRVVSDAQLDAALVGTRFAAGNGARRARFPELAGLLQGADAVLIAAVGPLVRVVARVVAGLDPRPVIVTGLPGISIPATRKALAYRRECDLFVLHSHREIREFAELAERCGIDQRFALSSLPFAHGAAARPGRNGGDATDLVFAAQAIVPRAREDRLRIARMLVAAAVADPSRRVVVKLRGRIGEAQTHAEQDPYPGLIESLGAVPDNLVFSTASMRTALDGAEGLVTVSSTAAVEAIARGLPVIVVDALGVSPELINVVFRGSGLFGGEDAVVARLFRHPDPAWLHDNYFHAREDDDFAVSLASLVARRRSGRLSPRAASRGRLRAAWDRRTVLGAEDRSLAGSAALVIGVPARAVVRGARMLRRQQPGASGASMQLSSTSAVYASTTRTDAGGEDTVTIPSTGNVPHAPKSTTAV